MLNHFTQLTDQDAGFLYLEMPETPQHVGSVSLVELPEGYDGDFITEYRRHIASRIHLNPLMHRKLVTLPFDLDHPFWVEDPSVDIDYHVRQQVLPAPGRIDQLEELVGRLHSNFLDRSRPLWELYVIRGLENGNLAIYSKIHHAAMDGAASQQLIATLYDPTPTPRHFDAPTPTRQDTTLGLGGLLRGVAEHVVRQEIRAAQFLPELLRTVSHTLLPNPDSLSYDTSALVAPLKPPKTLLNVAITSQRVFAMRTLSLSRCKRVAKAANVKLNDVVMALCGTALRRYLQENDTLPSVPLTAMVPVSLHDANDSGTANNNAAMLCSLATHLDDPLERLVAISESTRQQKKVLGNYRNLLAPDLWLVGSSLLVRGAIEIYRHAHLADRLPHTSNVIISNVAGPPVPLYINGAKVLGFHPCSIPFHGTALNITVESYCDSLDFGFTACRRTVRGLAQLADDTVAALDELEAALVAAAAKAQASASAALVAKPAPVVKTKVKPKAQPKATVKSTKPTPKPIAKPKKPAVKKPTVARPTEAANEPRPHKPRAVVA